MKKNDNPNSLRRFKLWRKLLIVKLLCVCLFLQNTALSASVYSQELKLTLKGNDISLTNIFSQIRESSDYTFVYNLDDIQNVRVKSLDVKDASIREVLDKCLKGDRGSRGDYTSGSSGQARGEKGDLEGDRDG